MSGEISTIDVQHVERVVTIWWSVRADRCCSAWKDGTPELSTAPISPRARLASTSTAAPQRTPWVGNGEALVVPRPGISLNHAQADLGDRCECPMSVRRFLMVATAMVALSRRPLRSTHCRSQLQHDGRDARVREGRSARAVRRGASQPPHGGGLYKPLADLLTADGYRITPNAETFTPRLLERFDILVISNALGAAAVFPPEASNPSFTPEASNPAFTTEESGAVRDWVQGGGSLLLIADHAPMGAANAGLAQRFGVEMSNGRTVDPGNTTPDGQTPGFIIYTRARVWLNIPSLTGEPRTSTSAA